MAYMCQVFTFFEWLKNWPNEIYDVQLKPTTTSNCKPIAYVSLTQNP